jgi:sugar fermentation stimulation protein A
MRSGAARIPLTVKATKPTRAVFVDRPHRFAARCRLESGEIVEAHLPNPGRLTGTLGVGRAVLLDGPWPEGARKLRWTCVAIREPRAWVGTVTQLVNRAFPHLLDDGLFPELGEVIERRPEVRHGASRFDWHLKAPDGSGTWVECKSVTLGRGARALFPDAVTARGARHLRELAALCRAGERCAVVFLAQRGDVESFEAARDIDPAFAEALGEARDAGVGVLAARLSVSTRGLAAGRRLALAM